jgi:hypothetical protein
MTDQEINIVIAKATGQERIKQLEAKLAQAQKSSEENYKLLKSSEADNARLAAAFQLLPNPDTVPQWRTPDYVYVIKKLRDFAGNPTVLRDLLGPILTHADCALDYMEGKTRVAFNGKVWSPELLKTEIDKCRAAMGENTTTDDLDESSDAITGAGDK